MKREVLRVESLGKAYRSYRSEWRRVLTWFGVPSSPVEEHWVLRGISFSVRSGETVGIVGQNGAGKSTLLKLITGTLRSSEGNIRVTGRIGAILDLGLGFNPDFTGRQNVYHSAGLMGFYHDEIETAMPAIEDFAEIGEYFDHPMRTYSTGMQMRVAFAVVTAFRPDVLIVDEALSVGDTYFQHKSFERIREFKRQGTTLLIVSHDRSAVQSLCSRAILLDTGRMIKDGEPEEVLDYYNALTKEKENRNIKQTHSETGRIQTTSGTGEAQVESVSLFSSDGRPVEFVNVGEKVELRITVQSNTEIPRLVFGYMIKDRLGQPVFGTNTKITDQVLKNVAPGLKIVYHVKFAMSLGVGTYSLTTALGRTDYHREDNYEWKDLALLFTVVNVDKTEFIGNAWIPPVIEIEGI